MSHDAERPDAGPTTVTTRRTIVRTGAKLAYAVPVVAASFKLAGIDNAAAVSVTCACLQFDCGVPAPGTSACACLKSTEGAEFCSNDFGCGSTDVCTDSSDCPAGWYCQASSDCAGSCGAVCVPPCGTAAAAAIGDAVGAGSNLGR